MAHNSFIIVFLAFDVNIPAVIPARNSLFLYQCIKPGPKNR